MAALAARHDAVERQIQRELKRPAPDDLAITRLKRIKLALKDQLYALRARAVA